MESQGELGLWSGVYEVWNLIQVWNTSDLWACCPPISTRWQLHVHEVYIVIPCSYLDLGSSNRIIDHLYFKLGSNFTSHKPLIQALIHLVTSCIALGFMPPYTLSTSTPFDLIWCFGLISPVGNRSGSPPLLSWAIRQHQVKIASIGVTT